MDMFFTFVAPEEGEGYIMVDGEYVHVQKLQTVMSAGVGDDIWTIENILALGDGQILDPQNSNWEVKRVLDKLQFKMIGDPDYDWGVPHQLTIEWAELERARDRMCQPLKPVDKSGNELKVGDRVTTLFYLDGTPTGEGIVTGFDVSPDYDRSCIGIFVDNGSSSVHPILIEKVE